MGQPMPTFLDPALGEPGPSISELAGRFVAFIPTGHDPSAKNFDGTGIAPSVTTDLVVLDGGNLYYGAAPRAPIPRPNPTHVVAVPAEFRGQIFSNVNVVGALKPAIGKGIVLGIVELSTIGSKGNKPWNVTPLAPSDPRRGIAHQYFAGRATGTITPNVPTELTPGVPAPQTMTALAQHYAPASQPQMTQPFVGQPQPVLPAAQGFQAAQFAPAVTPAPQAQPVPDMAAFAAWQAQQAAVVPPAPAIPAGFEAAWPHMNEEQRAAVIASQAPSTTANPY
jgi:hypothetical protein